MMLFNDNLKDMRSTILLLRQVLVKSSLSRVKLEIHASKPHCVGGSACYSLQTMQLPGDVILSMLNIRRELSEKKSRASFD
jgi:hypothetical protein